MQPNPQTKPLTGLLLALVIVALWLSSLAFLLSIDIAQLQPLWLLPAVLGRTFIQTGLFIVAHDAIHGTVMPSHCRFNDRVGQLALTLYALLPYQRLSRTHWQHHQHPGRTGDPDFHDGVHDSMVAWYLTFMQGYLDRRQRTVLFFGMSVIFFTLHLGFHVAIANLFWFWVLPIVLSSIQLFFFGTYLPHRAGQGRSHHATSSNDSLVWSFLSCYHFGYHWEHHEYPSLPWYRLPSVRQSNRQRRDDSEPLTTGVLATLNGTQS